ncbi:MAG TPA: hypothetical protein PLO33_01540 [Kouleothrix sp.]|uniref:hypothetical protein n=1 Tax=Kouleothrix sp. TaxID=2779161 RepID=UPI002BE3DF57|nr:hypothetical protein [Kouleothrix sp.]HRC74327.1 hypothetical protein [Kouleothrix sp.]
MEVTVTDLEGRTLGVATLRRLPDRRLVLNEQLVITVRIVGSRTTLVVDGRQVCVATADYARVRAAG